MSFKQFITSMLADERGSTSHKRVIVSLGALCLFVGLFIPHINEHVAELVAGIVAFGMGFTTWDKFSLKKKNDE
jgi:Na+/H+ antiporter NhaC